MIRTKPLLAVALMIVIIIVTVFANLSNTRAQESQPFHVGVTFGGDTAPILYP